MLLLGEELSISLTSSTVPDSFSLISIPRWFEAESDDKTSFSTTFSNFFSLSIIFEPWLGTVPVDASLNASSH